MSRLLRKDEIYGVDIHPLVANAILALIKLQARTPDCEEFADLVIAECEQKEAK